MRKTIFTLGVALCMVMFSVSMSLFAQVADETDASGGVSYGAVEAESDLLEEDQGKWEKIYDKYNNELYTKDRFNEADTDGDGVVSAAEAKAASKEFESVYGGDRFRMADKNGVNLVETLGKDWKAAVAVWADELRQLEQYQHKESYKYLF